MSLQDEQEQASEEEIANGASDRLSRRATLTPFLHNLPAPQARSPRKSVVQLHNLEASQDADYGEATPTRAVFELGQQIHQNEEELDEEVEFESHYSRQSSPASSDSSDEEGDDLGGDESDGFGIGEVQRVNSLPASAHSGHQHAIHGGLHMSRSTTALTMAPPPIPRPLYPPFYNKPPTPLPPSPSLTSLLRPPSLLNRSTTSTRPVSPDSSDVETPNDTEAQVAQQARRANPVPPTAPKVPTYEYYGFVLYLASSLAFLMYILWAYLPSPFLHALGITYYPDRWWALAIPAWIVMVLVYIYIALACYNVEYLTLGLGRVETVVDEAGSVAILDEHGRIRKGGSKRWVTELDERKRREVIAEQWHRKKKGAGSGRSRKKDKREREKADEYYGYTGEVTKNGVASGLSWRQIWNEGTDAVMDVPLGGVCEVLYGEGREIL